MLPTSPETLKSFGFVRVLDAGCKVLEAIAIVGQSKLIHSLVREKFTYACIRVLTESKGYYIEHR